MYVKLMLGPPLLYFLAFRRGEEDSSVINGILYITATFAEIARRQDGELLLCSPAFALSWRAS
jgi:hypothetical protein